MASRGQCLPSIPLALLLLTGMLLACYHMQPPARPIPAQLTAATVAGSVYTALPPTRLLDTRAAQQSLGPTSSTNLTVTGTFGSAVVPENASSVVLNVTVTDTTAPSYLTVFPTGSGRPDISNLNWTANETVSNLAIVQVGAEGEVTFYNDAGQVAVIADLEGYFALPGSSASGGSYVPLSPSRIADTRAGSGAPYAGTKLQADSSLTIQVTGVGSVPASGVAAVMLNITVTNTTATSYLSVFPEGEPRPGTSDLNWGATETVAHRALVPINGSGQIVLYNRSGSADVIVDTNGYFTSGASGLEAGGLYIALTPTRLLDTRATGVSLGDGITMTEPVVGSVIPDNANAVVANLTVTDASAPSFLTVYPDGNRPPSSDLNWAAGQTMANLDLASLSTAGTVTAHVDTGTAALVLDVFGYFTSDAMMTLTAATCSDSAMSTNVSSGVVGDPVTVSVTGSCPLGTASFEYDASQVGGSWTQQGSWVGSNTFTYDTGGWPAGSYTLTAWVSNSPQVGPQAQTQVTFSLSATGGFGVSGITVFEPQVDNEDCEEAALQIVLEHEGIYPSQPQLLSIEGVDSSVPGIGPGLGGDPYRQFVGPPNGPGSPAYEPGTYFPPVARAAQTVGGTVLAAGQGITPDQLFTAVEDNHPAVAWVTFDWRHYTATTICAGGDCFPWAGNNEHGVAVIGIGANSVLIMNPLRASSGFPYTGKAWVPMAVFDSAYATYGDMAVIIN
ncbi:MAG: C39 family peptidase [Candidatus Dormibacteria bacterium]